MANELTSSSQVKVAFLDLIDLASNKVGGKALSTNDDFFASMDGILKPEPAVFIPGKYIDQGKWMDGWESRRKRVPGFDHCIVKLGLPGQIIGVNIDTAHFTGNYPEYASVDACELSETATSNDLKNAQWKNLLTKSALSGNTQNCFGIANASRFTHVRLNIYPDGGVARFRVHGVVKPSQEKLKGLIDVAAAENGGTVIACNDSYFSQKDNIIYPGRATNMGEGWETRRKRGPGSDWIILKLAGNAKIKKIEVDTNFFKGNFPDRCSIEAIHVPSADLLPCDFRDNKDLVWTEILPEQKLQASHQHYFEKELNAANLNQKYNYIKLHIFPDGGVSRLRITGELA